MAKNKQKKIVEMNYEEFPKVMYAQYSLTGAEDDCREFMGSADWHALDDGEIGIYELRAIKKKTTTLDGASND